MSEECAIHSMDAGQHAVFMTQKKGVEKAPKGCKIIRTFQTFDELPGHVKSDKELLAHSCKSVGARANGHVAS